MNSEIDNKSDFSSFYQVLYNNPPYINGVNVKNDCIKYFNEVHNYFTVSPGAQYIVPKKYIVSRSIEFWKQLYEATYNEGLSPYSMENLWYLSFKHNMNNTVGNHDIEKTDVLILLPRLTLRLIVISQNIILYFNL